MFVNVMCKVTNCVNFSAVTHLFFQRYGSEVDGLPEVLAEKVSLLPELLKVTKAENTYISYKRGFNRWRRWGYANGLSSGDALPAKAFQVALYLASIIQTANSASPIINAFYSIKYYHDLFDYVSPTDSRLVINVLEAAKRRLAKPVNKKEPMTVDLLQQMYTHMYVENDVMNQRFICICLLSYAGFLRSAEVLKLRRSDVCINSSYLSVFIESSKTDKFREGAWVLIAKTGTQLCPVVNLQKYLTWTDFPSESEFYLFRRLSSTKCGRRLRQENKFLSYSTFRELFLSAFKPHVRDISKYCLHSLRAGGATAAANNGIPDRLFKRHGRWLSETAKDGYVKNSVDERLRVSMSLGL